MVGREAEAALVMVDDDLRVWMIDIEHEIDGRGSAWPDVTDEEILRTFLDKPVRVPSGDAPI